jgi:hypothetical protein
VRRRPMRSVRRRALIRLRRRAMGGIEPWVASGPGVSAARGLGSLGVVALGRSGVLARRRRLPGRSGRLWTRAGIGLPWPRPWRGRPRRGLLRPQGRCATWLGLVVGRVPFLLGRLSGLPVIREWARSGGCLSRVGVRRAHRNQARASQRQRRHHKLTGSPGGEPRRSGPDGSQRRNRGSDNAHST